MTAERMRLLDSIGFRWPEPRGEALWNRRWMKANHHKWLQNGCGYLTLSDLDGRNQEGRHCGIDTLVSLWSTRTWYGHNNIIICNCPIHQSTRHHYFIHFVFCPKPLMRSTGCLCSRAFTRLGTAISRPSRERKKILVHSSIIYLVLRLFIML